MIRLAVLDKDKQYLNKFAAAFGTRYADKIEIYSYTEKETAVSMFSEIRFDVLLASDAFDIEPDTLPASCGFAYFVDDNGVDTLNGQRAVGKFQKADIIYKEILYIYSEHTNESARQRASVYMNGVPVYLFQSVSGGSGASTLAAACAMNLASRDLRVLYLALGENDIPDLYFQGEGIYSMSEVIYTVKERKSNLVLRLESFMKKDSTDVRFFSKSDVILEMLELTEEDILELISELQLCDLFDAIVVDKNFSFDKKSTVLMDRARKIYWISDGTQAALQKLERNIEGIRIQEEKNASGNLDKISVIYNKCPEPPAVSKALPVFAALPVYGSTDCKSIAAALARREEMARIG